MTPGGVIALTAWALFVAVIVYGVSCDVRRWWQRRRSQRQLRSLELGLLLVMDEDPTPHGRRH